MFNKYKQFKSKRKKIKNMRASYYFQNERTSTIILLFVKIMW